MDIIPNYVSWDNYFMSLAFLVSTRSKDRNTKVGAVVVMDDKSIFTGYNGCPRYFNDDLLATPDKHSYVRHAEDNALDFAGLERCRSQHGLTLYTTIAPCPKCALKLAHFNVKRVVYYSNYKSTVNDFGLSEKIRMAGAEPSEHPSYVYTIERYKDYNGELLFSHSHMGVQ